MPGPPARMQFAITPLATVLTTALTTTLFILAGMVIIASTSWAGSPGGPTLAAVRQAGMLRCGVSIGHKGFSSSDASGRWSGFDVDYCRAVAAATLGKADLVTFVPATVLNGLQALSQGEVDILSRTVTITLKRVVEFGLHPVGVNFFDGQGFLVRRDQGLRTLRQLSGRSICVQSGTTAEDNLRETFLARRIAYTPVVFVDFQEMIRTLVDGGCDAVTADSSGLASIRVSALPHPEDYIILRQRISKEPLGPQVRKGDDDWLEIARWTLMAMIEAEELGISRASVDAMRSSDNPRAMRLLGLSPSPPPPGSPPPGTKPPSLGRALGLDDEWAYRIVSQVGNYGDIFEANLGAASPLKLDRGLNELWTRGGLLFALPLR
ncbi:MAG: amino acid ABC transporter substrate-binding protein [Rhodospirillaceae bacterium]